MSPQVGIAILIGLLVVLVVFSLYVRAYIKWLFREDLKRNWQWAKMLYEMRDELNDLRSKE